MKEEFLYEGTDSYQYWGQSHKKCHYEEKKRGFYLITLKRLGRATAQAKKKCIFCRKPLLQKNFRDAVKDHCHLTGKFQGAAHNACNNKLRIKTKTLPIPMVFHNLRGYDAHHLMQATSQHKKELSCIAINMEKYITFFMDDLGFIDSLNFLQGNLDSLVSAKEDLKIAATLGSELLYRKGIYPYEYMDSWERFEETSLPEKERFHSNLTEGHITEEEYEQAKKVWEECECQTLGDHHDLYVETDEALLADVYENFRNLCQ